MTARTARPRVLFYSDADDVGGAEVHLAGLVETLGDRVQATVALTDDRVAGWLGARCAVPIRTLPRVQGKSDLRGLARHVRLVRAVRPDILHVNLPHPWTGQYALMASAFAPTTRVVAVEHSPRPTASAMQRRLRRMVQRRIDAHVTVGHGSARALEELLDRPAGSIRVIHNGVPDLARTDGADGEPSRAATGAPTVGFVGRLAHEKGPDVLLRALAELPDVQVTMVGNGPDEAAVVALADQLGVAGRVTFTGWHEHPRELLPRFDVLAVPSRIESFGLVAVEAMLAERPVVASAVGSVPEVVADGVTGLLVEPEDPAALAAALRAVLADRDRAAAMGRAGRARALECFTLEQQAAAFLALYEELLDGHA